MLRVDSAPNLLTSNTTPKTAIDFARASRAPLRIDWIYKCWRHMLAVSLIVSDVVNHRGSRIQFRIVVLLESFEQKYQFAVL